MLSRRLPLHQHYCSHCPNILYCLLRCHHDIAILPSEIDLQINYKRKHEYNRQLTRDRFNRYLRFPYPHCPSSQIQHRLKLAPLWNWSLKRWHNHRIPLWLQIQHLTLILRIIQSLVWQNKLQSNSCNICRISKYNSTPLLHLRNNQFA